MPREPTKVPCPKCGDLNYSTDPVCLGCGATLEGSIARPPMPVRRHTDDTTLAARLRKLVREDRGWVGALVSLGLFLAIFCVPQVWKDLRVHTVYRPVTCTVLDKRVTSDSGDDSGAGPTFYYPTITVTYRLGDQNYTVTDERSLGPHFSRQAAAAVLHRYQVGQSYRGWCDPNDPRQAVVNRGLHWPFYAALAGFILFALVGTGWRLLGRRSSLKSGSDVEGGFRLWS